MFGMLDYRAHKLYALLFYIPIFLLRWLSLIILPFISYGIGMHFADERIWQVVIAIAVVIPVEIVWMIIAKIIGNIIQSIFSFIVDVIPCDGRSKEEAQLVVWGGDKTITLLEFDKLPAEWTEEAIQNLPKTEFIRNLFYRQETKDRVRALKQYYLENPDVFPSEYTSDSFYEDQNIAPSMVEKIATNTIYRGWVVTYGIFICLLIFNPSG